MAKALILLGLILLLALSYIFINNIDRSNYRRIILSFPLVMGTVLFLAAILVDNRIVNSDWNFFIFLSLEAALILLFIGLFLNIINLVLVFKGTSPSERSHKYRYQLLIFIVLMFIFLISFIGDTRLNRQLSEKLELDIPYSLGFKYKKLEGSNSDGVIHIGRGILRDENIARILNDESSNWRDGRLPEEIYNKVFKLKLDGYSLYKETRMKKIDQGQWYYRALDKEGKDYILGLIDLDRQLVYYIEYNSKKI